MQTPASTSIALLEPTSLEEARALARDIVESGLFPKIKSPGGALIFIMTARDLGLPLSQALRMIDVIEGKQKDPDTGQFVRTPTVSLRAELQVALVRRDPRCAFLELEHDPTELGADPTFAVWRTAFARDPSDVKRASFTLEEATRMGLTDRKQWAQQAPTMLMWRAATRLIKRWWADVTLGLADPDEAREEVVTIEASTTAAALPSSNRARLGAVLAAPGVLLEGAELVADVKASSAPAKAAKAASAPKASSAPSSAVEAPKAFGEARGEVKAEDEATRELGLSMLRERYSELVRRIGPDATREVWTRDVGDVAKLRDPSEIKAALADADEVLRSNPGPAPMTSDREPGAEG